MQIATFHPYQLQVPLATELDATLDELGARLDELGARLDELGAMLERALEGVLERTLELEETATELLLPPPICTSMHPWKRS